MVQFTLPRNSKVTEGQTWPLKQKAKGNKGYKWVHAFRASLLESSIEVPRRLALNKNR